MRNPIAAIAAINKECTFVGSDISEKACEISKQRIDAFITKECKKAKVSIEELKSGSRRKEVSALRARIVVGLVEKYGVALAGVARRVGVSTSAISKIMHRPR